MKFLTIELDNVVSNLFRKVRKISSEVPLHINRL